VYPGDSPGGVLLAQVEEWGPPVPMNAVLSQIDRSEGARADFEASFGSPLTNLRPLSLWRPDARSRRSSAGRFLANAGPSERPRARAWT
jgi:hypothetical protein